MSHIDTSFVFELGEEGESFLVTGSREADEAKEMVRQYCINAWGETLERNHGVDHIELEAGAYRTDWAWQPVSEIDPMEEARLIHGDDAPQLAHFPGWLVSVK